MPETVSDTTYGAGVRHLLDETAPIGREEREGLAVLLRTIGRAADQHQPMPPDVTAAAGRALRLLAGEVPQ